jgi:hypothetical protein
MAIAKKTTKKKARGGGKRPFRVEGRVRLEKLDSVPEELVLTAYVFDDGGKLLASGPVGEEGGFALDLPLAKPADVQVVVSPQAGADEVRRATTYSRKYVAADWQAEARRHLLRPSIYVIDSLVRLWWPIRICVSGHVRKVVTDDAGTHYCPVPFAKVEVFDVDRESCWWPYIVKLKDLLKDRLVVRADDLIAEGPELASGVREALERARRVPVERPREPIPGPDPVISASRALVSERINPTLNPQPEVPSLPAEISPVSSSSARRVGEVAGLELAEARALEQLSITARLAPWLRFPWCFYSRQKVCQDFTDCNGYFACCFNWYPFHVRRGRLRFDLRPDIVIRVTQVIDGVETVIYVDPYTSTRWNSGSTHIDLFLDDEEIICGPGCGPQVDLGDCEAAVLQLGRDELWKMNRLDGLYSAAGESNGAYGSTLLVRGDFAPAFKDGSPKRYYLLSWAKATGGGGVPADSEFHSVQTPMEAWRATPGGVFSSYLLGPQPAGPVAGLYEVQDTAHWWIPKNFPLSTPGGMILGLWPTGFESDEDTYWLRLEVFDQTGNKLTAAQFCNYQGNGSGLPVPPTSSTGKLDLKVHIDNAPMPFELETPAINECGVIQWTPTLQLPLTVKASQANGRVHRWWLKYNKGVNPTELWVTPGPSSDHFSSGVGSVNQAVNANGLLTGLTSTCAFGLHLRAWSHVRVNYGWRYHGEKSYAIAIEKCPPCPE